MVWDNGIVISSVGSLVKLVDVLIYMDNLLCNICSISFNSNLL